MRCQSRPTRSQPTTHRATVVNIKGESYRMKEKRLTGLFPGLVALPDAPTKGGPRTKTKQPPFCRAGVGHFYTGEGGSITHGR